MMRQSSARRRGVSLMEVLFAIGITLTGLLGVVALLPVAAHYGAKGLKLDQATAIGQNAVHEMELRGAANPNNWLMWNPKPDPFAPSSPLANPPTVEAVLNLRAASVIQPGESYCIDPRFVGYHGTPNWSINSRLFPYGLLESSGRPAMWRVSLKSSPYRAFSLPQAPMSLLQANDIFLSSDDLAFNLPIDATVPPIQEYGVNNEKRQPKGNMSWFATLTPKLTQAGQVYDSFDPNFPQQGTDLYVLSIVVVAGRDSGFSIVPQNPASALQEGTSPNELITDVSFYGGFDGGGGGDIEIRGPTEDVVQVQEGDWMMLCRFVPRVNIVNQSPVGRTAYFRWYRVAGTDEEANPQTPTGPWTRSVSLIGSDWNSSSSAGALSFPALIQGAPNVWTQAVVVKGVIAVYEKTIRLEHSTLWAR